MFMFSESTENINRCVDIFLRLYNTIKNYSTYYISKYIINYITNYEDMCQIKFFRRKGEYILPELLMGKLSRNLCYSGQKYLR